MLEMFEQGQLDYLVVGNKLYKTEDPTGLGLIEMVFKESAYFRVRWLGVNFGFNDYPFEMVYQFNFQKGSQTLDMDLVVQYHKKMNFYNRDIYLKREVKQGLRTESQILDREKLLLKMYKSDNITLDKWNAHMEALDMIEYDQWYQEELQCIKRGDQAAELERVLHKMGLIDWFGKPERIKEDQSPEMAYVIERLAFNRLTLNLVSCDDLRGFRCFKEQDSKRTIKLYHKDLDKVMDTSDFLNTNDTCLIEKNICKKQRILALDTYHPNYLMDEFIAF